jgi:hypothetical protein
VIRRATVFALWGGIGAALSYGALYAFTLFGLGIIGVCLAAAAALPTIGGTRSPEILGLVAGPGVLCLLVAANAADPLPWIAAAGALLAGELVGYTAAGRAGCGRRA